MTRLPQIFAIGLIGFGILSTATAAEPVVVVSLKPLQELLADMACFGEITQDPKLSAALGQLGGGQQLLGVDLTKPIRLCVSSISPKPSGVLLIPVNDSAKFQMLLGSMMKVVGTQNGLTSYRPAGTPITILSKPGATQFAFGLDAASLSNLPETEGLPPVRTDLDVSLNLAKMPQPLKDLVLDKASHPGRRSFESTAQQRGYELGFDASLNALRHLLAEGERLQVGFDVNSKSKTTAVYLDCQAKPNTEMAEALVSFGKMASPFPAGIADASLGRINISIPLNEDLQNGMVSAFEEELRDQGTLDAAQPIVDLLRRSLLRGRLDAFLKFKSQSSGKLQLAGGMGVKDGKELGQFFEQAVKSGGKESKVEIGVATVNGKRIDAVSGDQKLVKTFGDPTVHLSFTDDAVLFNLGPESLSHLKQSLVAAPATATVGSAPITFQFSFSSLIAMGEKDPRVTKLAQEVLVPGTDSVLFEVGSAQPNLLRAKIEFQESAMRFAVQSDKVRRGTR